MNLRILLTASVTVLMLFVVGFSGSALLQAYHKQQEFEFVKERSKTVTELLHFAADLSAERSLVENALAQNAAADIRTTQKIDQYRAKSNASFKAILRDMEALHFPGRDELVVQLEPLYNSVLTMRTRVDRALEKSQLERNSSLSSEWPESVSKLIITSQDLRFLLTQKIGETDPVLNEFGELKHFMWMMSEYADRERTLVSNIIASDLAIDEAGISAIADYRGRIQTAWRMVQKMTKDSTAEVLDGIKQVQHEFFVEFESLHKAVYTAGINGAPYPISSQEWFEQSSGAIAGLLAVEEASIHETGIYIEQLLNESKRDFALNLALLLLSIAIASYTVWLVALRVVKPLNQMATAMGNMAQGNRADIPELNSRNEIGNIARSLQKIDDIGQNALRIKSALDSVTSNVMMADAEHNIVYTNPAVEAMLQEAEPDIQEQLPQFDAANLVGNNISIFHEKPEHQTQMLEKLSTPYETTITVSSRIFDLIASPVFNNDNGRIGTVVEWRDMTQDKAIEAEIAGVVDAVAKGDFTKRLDEDGKQDFMLSLCQGINTVSETSEAGLNEVVKVLQLLSDGQLTDRIEGEYQGTFDDIKQALNSTIDKLRSMVRQIQDAASTVSAASNEISSGSADLSQRTEHQASTLEETAASMEELTDTVRTNGSNANHASELSSDASNIASKGGEVVGSAVEAMRQIEDSSTKIADIISVIDEIAFQTNLLALNAAVEAARAGEAGKGFAVVASEVRTLAGRSAAASKDIKSLIKESVEQVSDGSALVNNAGDTLQQIVESTEQVAHLIAQIAKAGTDQTNSIEEINIAVSQMDESTQQNAALVEENTAAAQSLVKQAQDLDKLVRFFVLNEDDTQTTAEPANDSESNLVRLPSNNEAVATSDVIQTGGGARTGTANYDDGWEEF